MTVKIANTVISHDNPPFIIAEAGINHNGKIEKAFQMIEIAKKSGSNAVKFQTFKAKEFISNSNLLFTYFSQGKKITEPMIDLFKRHEFSEKEWLQIKKKCNEEKIIFLSSPLNPTDLEFLLKLNIPAIKLGSTDFTNLPFIRKCTATKLPLILSCGMSFIEEINQTLNFTGSLNGYPTILLLTTSEYPTPEEDVNILRLPTLSIKFPNIVLGYSDHTIGTTASIMAVALGARVFEKHFTTDNNLRGPDHWFSENPSGLQSWIKSIKEAYLMLGNKEIKPTNQEIANKKENHEFHCCKFP